MNIDEVRVRYELKYEPAVRTAFITPVVTLKDSKSRILPCTVLVDGHELFPTSRLPSVAGEELTFSLKTLKIINPALHRQNDDKDSNVYRMTFKIFGLSASEIVFCDEQDLYIDAPDEKYSGA